MKMLINGQWIDTDGKIGVVNPFNGKLIDTVPMATVYHVRQALRSATMYDHRLTAWERYEIIHNFCYLLKKEENDFVELISKESGKPIKESRIEVERSYQTFLISAEEAKRINGEVLPIDAIKGMRKNIALTMREPLGVIVAITPFNYPLNLVAHKVGPALAANNAVVLKPSSLTPLTSLRMAALFLKAGLPTEMLHVITGDSREIGDELIMNPIVQKVTFTGSVSVGKSICDKIGMKKVCMELGGNDPLIVLRDANIEKAVSYAVVGAFGNNGQRCTSIKRIIIENCIADDFRNLFVEEVKKLRVGDQMDPATDIGPLITEDNAKEIEIRVNSAVLDGAKIVCGGKREGSLYYPTILDNVSPKSLLVTDETFGPVAPIIRVKDFNEAIEMANSTPFGLQAGIFTNDLTKAMIAARQIEAGAVIINNGPGFRAEHLPFGGVKDSGIGREGVKYAIQEMTRLKTVVFYEDSSSTA
jgi:lactaldehyde dehydrogenase